MSPPAYVCNGKHCSKQAGRKELITSLDDVASVVEVRCQKICKGPVVGVEVDGSIEWFKRIDNPKRRKAVHKLVRKGGPLGKRLRKRRVAKRSGLLRT